MTTVVDAHVQYLAHHGLLLAIPAFLPAVIVVGVVLYISLRDRRTTDGDKHARSANSDQDGSAPN